MGWWIWAWFVGAAWAGPTCDDLVGEAQDPALGAGQGFEVCLDLMCWQQLDVVRLPDGQRVLQVIVLQRKARGLTTLPEGTPVTAVTDRGTFTFLLSERADRQEDPSVGLRWVLRTAPDDELLASLAGAAWTEVQVPAIGKKGLRLRVPAKKGRRAAEAFACLAGDQPS